MKLNTAQTLALNLDSHIVIDAGAGTGKTSTIIERVIEHYLTEDQRATRILPVPERPSVLSGGMLSAAPAERADLREWGGLLPGEVVLITFTNRAADEMKDRLRSKILSLRYGSKGIGDEIRTDPRIRDDGFVEQLLTLLDDAPIGTIDSFLNRLTSPYKWKLGNSLSRGNISDTGRILITEQAMKTIWRLPSSPSRIGDAVDAGIPGNIATQVIEARDRLSIQYSNHRYAKQVLSSLVANSDFLDEASRKIIDENGIVDPSLIRRMLLDTIEEETIHEHARHVHHSIGEICELIKENLNLLEIKKGKGWRADTRVSCLDSLNDVGPPKDTWETLVWLSQVLDCTVTQPSLFNKKKMTFFPHDHFPVDSWEAGIKRPSQISDKSSKKAYQDKFRELKEGFTHLWNRPQNSFVLHFVRMSILLSDGRPSQAPEDWRRSSEPLRMPIPERLDSKPSDFHYSMDAEASNLQDLYLLQLGFRGIIGKIKETQESHDFDDIRRFAGDILLANCPEACRSYYPVSVQKALDSLEDEAWRDDHIHLALSIISDIESDSEKSDEYYNGIAAVRRDLEERFSILKSIRRRYRAFIIDEAQDNSPLQWRILSRLWGERETNDGEKPPPETPWQPTVCYVGDVKQSIYAFRQAEVSGFRDFANTLMAINDHEISTVRELTRKPALRKESESRNPRNSSALTITKGSEYTTDAGRHLEKWIPFNAAETGKMDTVVPANEVQNRKRGLIRLSVNYRTSGGLIRAMNEWWEDIFSRKYNDIPGANYYANSQPLSPCDDKLSSRGSIEWICPVNSEEEGNPSINLDEPIDPFGSSKGDPLERQAMLIALRIRSLIDGSPARIISEEGWKRIDSEEPIEPKDIMILLPTRPRIREAIVRQLRNLEIPVQIDQEGGLLERPIVHALNGLLQLVAHPTSIHYATWVCRSPLIGMNDEKTQDFSREVGDDEDLLHRLASFSTNSRQRSLLERWCSLANQSRIIDILEETLEFSDLLTAFPEDSSRQEADQFVDVVREISSEAGGDPIVIADSVREIMESDPEKLDTKTIPAGDSVRMMTIHSAKGLEAKVVVLADLFSKRQINMTNDYSNRLIVTPEIFAGHPNPWPSQGTPDSAIWDHAKMLHKSRKIAEARRLLYVGATRAEEKLIIVGSSGATHTNKGINNLSTRIPWITGKDDYYQDRPKLGQMWLRSLAIGSARRSEEKSPWIPPNENSNEVLLEPEMIIQDAFLGSSGELGMAIFHHPDCFSEVVEWEKQVITTKTRIKNASDLSILSPSEPEENTTRKDASVRVRVSPSNLTDFQDCSRRHWLETRGGLTSQAISTSSGTTSTGEGQNKLDKAVFGTIFHRILEIGIGNPGPGQDGPSTPLLNSWTIPRPNRIHDEEIHETVFQEYLPPGSDKGEIARLAKIMASRINDGVLGEMVSGKAIDGHILEGLRTELPFHISLPLESDGITQTRWSPEGNQQLSIIESPIVETSGIIDLVLCTQTEDGESTIRAVDLKTEEAETIEDQHNTGLLESIGNRTLSPACRSEEEILNRHRMQLALYHRALEATERSKENLGLPSRKVLPPAILIGVTGRIVEFPREILEKSLVELDELLERSAIMATKEELPISDFPRLGQKESAICRSCPFNRGAMPFCGPIAE